ncbi:MAG: tripartite tricarboxylate transporter permease [Candidatus Pacearchaeota archaeon]|jgi:putative membrane protein
MLITFVIILLLGILAGTLTGLCPGIHINLVGTIIISLFAILTKITSPINIIIFVVAMGISHSFIDFIPSIFLGAPEEDTFLSVLPGHLMLKKGLAYEAIFISSLGCLFGTFITLIIAPIFIILLPKFQNILTILIPYVLILSVVFLISKENKKFIAIIVFILSGFLGLAVLNLSIKEPLLPMLSGLFGVSSLMISIKTKVEIPPQIITKPKVRLKNIKKPLLASILFSPLCSIFPAIGSGQASAIGSSFFKLSKKGFLFLVGSANTIVLGLSFIVLYSIAKSRTGIAATVNKIIPVLSSKEVLIILITIIITGVICFYLTLYLAKKFSKIISSVNYQKVSIVVIIIISLITLIVSGFIGLLILAISSAVGLFGIQSGARRINLIGCLMLPTILIYIL